MSANPQLFSTLLGAHTKVMNAPGTTVLLETGRLHYRGPDGNGPAEVWDCTDTPGTYSLLPLSPDEKVAADAVMGAEGLPRPDLVVAVLDATNIARSLYFLAMVVELGAPTVVALTMNDLTEAHGCGVDAERLSALLDGLPVVAVDGRTGAGTDRLVRAIADGFRGTPVPEGLHPLTGTANVRAWVEDHADARFDWAARIIRGLDLQMRDRVALSRPDLTACCCIRCSGIVVLLTVAVSGVRRPPRRWPVRCRTGSTSPYADGSPPWSIPSSHGSVRRRPRAGRMRLSSTACWTAW
ncbi:MAG: FeoB small GTPase domain-containing protein [Bifidobacterium pullorum]